MTHFKENSWSRENGFHSSKIIVVFVVFGEP
jgi:hypothetical protein